MTDDLQGNEIQDRLRLIESMISEGRRKTESWGWTFVLWGVAYYVALGWSIFGDQLQIPGGSRWAWPVTMTVAGGLTMILGGKNGKGQPETTAGRAVGALWMCVGISMMVLFLALSLTGQLRYHAFVATLAAMLGVANGTSGILLKWKMQFACAMVWWLTSVAACFGSETQLTVVFLAALFVCQIVFGIYAMVLDARRRGRLQGAVHV